VGGERVDLAPVACGALFEALVWSVSSRVEGKSKKED
jgi:hypothetical protein